VAVAWAAMEGRDFVIPDDIKRMAIPALAHRLAVTAEAELEGTDAAAVLTGLLGRLEVPR
jgi:MoxR-like ATPase